MQVNGAAQEQHRVQMKKEKGRRLVASSVSDIDECASRTHDCTREGEFCVNTNGSFTCECDTGYINIGDRCEGERVCLLPVILFRIPSRVCSHCVLLCCPGTLSCCVALALCPVVLPWHCVLLCCPGTVFCCVVPGTMSCCVAPGTMSCCVAPARCVSVYSRNLRSSLMLPLLDVSVHHLLRPVLFLPHLGVSVYLSLIKTCSD